MGSNLAACDDEAEEDQPVLNTTAELGLQFHQVMQGTS